MRSNACFAPRLLTITTRTRVILYPRGPVIELPYAMAAEVACCLLWLVEERESRIHLARIDKAQQDSIQYVVAGYMLSESNCQATALSTHPLYPIVHPDLVQHHYHRLLMVHSRLPTLHHYHLLHPRPFSCLDHPLSISSWRDTSDTLSND